jgi:hypothetical protein
VWALKINGAFRDSAQSRLQTSSEIHREKYTQTRAFLYHVHIHIHMKLRFMAENILNEEYASHAQ